MAYPSSFSEELWKKVRASNVLVVGAGGIGCELLKNLVLTGFENIEIVDLDTIDVSNLNRQFLFHKEHVGKPKALVARESVLRFNPKANITAHHRSIISCEYGIDFFKKFTVVMNALDNLQARSYVNRHCLAAKVPLIDSGTAGYQGQVEVISKGLTLCYECLPKPPQKTYPSCTIRNHPSEHIHCTIWAKHLFNQLYGQQAEEEDISPDFHDPELRDFDREEKGENGISRRATLSLPLFEKRFDARRVFEKVFLSDIKYLLTMKHLWKNRRPPLPLYWDNLPDANEGSSKSDDQPAFKDQVQWTIAECRDVFSSSIESLKQTLKGLGEGAVLTWDKDDDAAMNFVAAAANLRAHIFGIPLKTKFEIKAMAGNIVPAIASSNAVIAGLGILQTLKVLKGEIKKCTSVYLRNGVNSRGAMIVPEKNLIPPVPGCYICADKPQITLVTDTSKLTCDELATEVLKNSLHLSEPDVMIGERIIISGDEEETIHTKSMTLAELNVNNGSSLVVEELFEGFTFKMVVQHSDSLKDVKFTLAGDITKILERKVHKEPENSEKVEEEPIKSTEDKNKEAAAEGDSDCEMSEETVNFADCYNSRKRKFETTTNTPLKKPKIQGSDSDPIVLN